MPPRALFLNFNFLVQIYKETNRHQLSLHVLYFNTAAHPLQGRLVPEWRPCGLGFPETIKRMTAITRLILIEIVARLSDQVDFGPL
jgi:hypothetical protein